MIVATDLEIPGRLYPTSLTVAAGERIAVVGPNGGGKTSLLRAMAGVEAAQGKVTVAGESLLKAVPARRRRMLGYLPASRDLHWPIAVRDLVALGLDHSDPARLDELLSRFELDGLAHRASDRLSTGERARVLMARALASQPELLLLDEPLSNLDPYWVLRFLEIINQEAARGAATMVSLHDLSHLDRFDRAVLVNFGRVEFDDTPDRLLASPAFEESFRVTQREGQLAISR